MDFDGASITMVALCGFIFVLFYNMKFLNKSNGWIAKVVSYLGKSTFGIYMMHMFVIERMLSIPFFNINDGNYRYQVIFNVIVVFVVSFAISQVVEFLIVNPLNRLVKFTIKLYDDKKMENAGNKTIKSAV
jgi:peptidoglycan/LPS O-acetylase OafA/YrhL